MDHNVLRQTVKQHFDFFKSANTISEALQKSIPLPNGAGYLLPICQLHLEDNSLINLLTDWRNKNVNIYPSRFNATPERTLKWMRDRLLSADDRMLFLVHDRLGHLIGHLGLANCFSELSMNKSVAEIDNVVRGDANKQPGLMSVALKTLVEWAQEKLLADKVFLRVMADNDHAIQFYRKNGFSESGRIPLYSETNGNEVNLKEVKDTGRQAEAEFVVMNYSSSKRPGEKLILTAGPSISTLESYYVNDAVNNGWNDNWAGYIKKFEKEFANYVGTKYALSTSSCTGALHLSLLALGIGEGDEVIVPDITWVATANAVAYTGATPIFCDVDINTWVMDPESVRQKITPKTKAIMPVHLYGHVCPMDEIMKIAKDHNLFVVEDAAPSIGATFKGRRTGSFGDFAAFSFQGAKLTVTGEGGMLVTNNEQLYEKVESLWNQGRDPRRTFWIHQLGWKYKMSNVQAALGLGQLERADALIEAKRRIFNWYQAKLANVSSIQLCYEPRDTRSIYWMSSIRVLPGARKTSEEVRSELKRRNVDTRPVFPAISQYPFWSKKQEPQSNAKLIGESSINLPSGVCLSKAEVDYVSDQLIDILS